MSHCSGSNPNMPLAGMPCAEDLPHWLRLSQTAGVGPMTARRLLGAFGLPGNIFSASLATLKTLVPEPVANALHAPMTVETIALIDATLAWCQHAHHSLLTWADTAYPRALLEIADPPLMLYVKGQINFLQRPAIAIVGSRRASLQGEKDAQQFAKTLSEKGWTIISGLAEGVDAAAHLGALHAMSVTPAAGGTVAIMGTGIDRVYPATHQELARKIVEAGCLVTEYPLGMPALAKNFPRRNRLIAGLSKGVLVVEAAEKSGSLITARMAAEQGREVFAMPGSIHSPLSKGCHTLIQQGAKLVASTQDILEELRDIPTIGNSRPCLEAMPSLDIPSLSTHPLLAILGPHPMDLDTLALQSGMTMATLHSELLALELAGSIERLPCGGYRCVVSW